MKNFVNKVVFIVAVVFPFIGKAFGSIEPFFISGHGATFKPGSINFPESNSRDREADPKSWMPPNNWKPISIREFGESNSAAIAMTYEDHSMSLKPGTKNHYLSKSRYELKSGSSGIRLAYFFKIEDREPDVRYQLSVRQKFSAKAHTSMWELPEETMQKSSFEHVFRAGCRILGRLPSFKMSVENKHNSDGNWRKYQNLSSLKTQLNLHPFRYGAWYDSQEISIHLDIRPNELMDDTFRVLFSGNSIGEVVLEELTVSVTRVERD